MNNDVSQELLISYLDYEFSQLNLYLTEEQLNNSFAEAFAHRISKNCFKYLDAPVETMGSLDTPAVPINLILEKEMLPNAEKLAKKIDEMLKY